MLNEEYDEEYEEILNHMIEEDTRAITSVSLRLERYWNSVADCACNMLGCLPSCEVFDLNYVKEEFAWYEEDTGHSIGYQDEDTGEWVCLSEWDVYNEMRRQREFEEEMDNDK